jgi:predicted permease
MRVREYVARGMAPDEARRAAFGRFGNVQRVNATCRAIGRQRDRDMRRTEYLSELTQDVSFACRQLLKQPGFTAVAVLTLALGIGATAAIFSAVHAVVLEPLPFPEADRILAIYEEFSSGRGNVSAGNYVDGVERARTFSAVTAIQYSSFNLEGSGEPERIIGARATAGFFDVFNLPPVRGRVFTKEEDRPGREQVVVLSHRLWTRRFAADPAIVGRQLRLNNRAYEVIGIMPAAFDFTSQSEELWVPIAFTPERRAMHDEHYLQIYGRLVPGASGEQAVAELNRNAERIRADFPRDASDLTFAAVTALEELVGDYHRRMYTLLGAVGFVLLIACGNIANLLLARSAARSGELAIRAALGAGRGRIVRQLLTESLVLAIVSAAAGLGLATLSIPVLIAAAPEGVPRLDRAAIDPVVLVFTLATALSCALLFGLAPAWRAARSDVHTILKEGGRGAGMGGVRDRLRTALIVAELAIALMLLVGAGLLIRSSLALQRVDLGFDPSGVMSVRLSLPADEFGEPARVVHALERIALEAAAIPGASAAGITSQVPMGGGGNGNGLIPEGRPIEPRSAISSRLRMVTPGYIEAMRIPLLQGRTVTDADRRGGRKVMVISRALAIAAFPGEDPIGKRIACCEPGPDGKAPDYKVVVGVVEDVRSRGPGEAPSPEFYLPVQQAPAEAWDWIQRTIYVVVRTTMEPEAMTNALRRTVGQAAPGVPLFNLRTMEQRLSDSLATPRFNTLLLTILGAIGLVLAAVGIYGVIAYFVARRTTEIGVRMALGATRRDVVALVLGQVAWPVGLGIGAGVAIAAVAARALSSQLFGVTAADPVTFGAVAVTLGAVALAASLIPAGRAASVDPTRALHAP